MTTANGMIRTPAARAEKPSTDCRYWVSRNSEPNRAKKVRVTARLAAVNRGFEKNETLSIGWSLCSSQSDEGAEHDDGDGEAGERGGRGPALRRGLDDRPQQGGEPDDRQHGADRVELRGADGSFEVGHEEATADEGDDRRSGRSPGRPSPSRSARAGSRRPAGRWRCPAPRSRPRWRWPGPARRGSVNTLVTIDSVAGMISAPPMPMSAAGGDELPGRAGDGRQRPSRGRRSTRPTVSAPRRPKRSPRLPAVSSRPANTSV